MIKLLINRFVALIYASLYIFFSIFHSNGNMASTSNDIVLRRLSAPEDGSSVTSVELRPITRKKQILVLNSGFLTICLVVGINQAYGVFQG